MTTLEEFRSTIKDMHEKLANPNNTIQKNQTLWQYIKEYCARTLEQRDLDETFEGDIKKELMAAQKQLADLKKASVNNTPTGSQAIPSQSPYQGVPMVSSPGFQPESSSSSSNTISSVPSGPFDPNSSPILRRLAQGKSIHESRIPSVEKIKPELSQKIESEEIEEEKLPESDSDITPQPTPSPFPQFPTSPFPAAAENKMELIASYLEIPQLNGRIELGPEIQVHRIGRKDIQQASKIQIASDFFNPIMERLEEETIDTPSEHFLIEQPLPGEFWIKDTGSLQKTYYNSSFVDSKGIKIQDGDKFIIPVNVNNQLASLTIIFHVKK